MSRLAWVAPACVGAAVVAGALLGGPAFADDPGASPTPTDTTTAPQLLAPTPTPTASQAAVLQLRAAVDTTGALVVTWRAGTGDTAYTASATAAGRTRRVESTGTTASFAGLPSGASVQVVVVAHGAAGDSPPARTTVRMPPAVPGVTGGRMTSTATGMLVSWQSPASVAVGTRYLVELRGADGTMRSRLVAGTSTTVTGLTRGRLYTGSITAVSDEGRSAPVSVGGGVWTPPAAASADAVAPPPVPSPARSAQAVAHTAAPALADAPTRRTLVSSPIAAAGLAAAAVVLGALAIGLLLRRPREAAAEPAPQTTALVHPQRR